MELIKDNVKVSLDWIGEGHCGDYDPDDPKDDKLLRLDVYKYVNYDLNYPSEWVMVYDSSYCTRMREGCSDRIKVRALGAIMEDVYDRVVSGESIKKLCEGLSYICDGDFEEGVEQ